MSQFSKSTEDVRRQMKQAFKDFDTDRSGYIQRHQLSVMMKRLTNAFNVEEPSDQDINELMRDLDVNGDGKISQNQFLSLVEEVITLIQQENQPHTIK